ncbi:hypothetical protein BDV35DRAFT_364664 [Aspergillus flavus]|uniref:Uncharacterized protein n=1 Tax=Aspergillus flavus TaxID=5059 RepID=A0A5N6GP94_ASPFL|nr:hypothetical protein BDV35DRAFT_364664 [Aspergillus flavus]
MIVTKLGLRIAVNPPPERTRRPPLHGITNHLGRLLRAKTLEISDFSICCDVALA